MRVKSFSLARVLTFSCIILILASPILSVLPVFGSGIIFSDGFETGNLSNWLVVNGNPSVTSGGAYDGTYKAVFAASDSVQKRFVTNYSQLFMRAYVQFKSFPPSGLNSPILGVFNYKTSRYVTVAQIFNDGGIIKWRLRYYDGGDRYVLSGQQMNPSLNTWYCVEVKAVSNSTTNSEARLYVNGIELTDVAQTGKNDNAPMNTGILQVLSSPASIWYDDVAIATTYVGPEVTLTTNVVGSGSVSKSPNQALYNWGTNVTLTATPSIGWRFDHWSGDATGTTNPVTVNMTSNKSVTATFTQNQYTLTINKVGSGTVAKSPDQSGYHYGDVVTLTATPSAGWKFNSTSGWSGDGTTDGSGHRVVNMTGNKNVTATFTQIMCTVSVTVGVHGSSNQTTETVAWNTTVRFLFTPDAGYHIGNVAVNGSSVGTPSTLSVLVEGPTAVNVSFAINTYSLTVTVGAHGISNQTSQTVNWGTRVGLRFTPDAGYHISDVSVNGSSVGTPSTLSVLVEGPTTVSVSFAINTYGLTVTVGAHGVSNQTSTVVNWGTTVGFLFTPNNGYHIASVTVNGTSVGTANTLSVLVEGPTTVAVNFAINTYTLTVNVGANGVSNQTTQTVNWGTIVGFLFTPNAGYHISSVTVNGTSVGTASTLSVPVQGPTTVGVTFAINTYTLTVNVGPNGACNQSTQTVNWDTTVGFLFTPNAGYHISSVTVNGTNFGTTNTLGVQIEGPTTVEVDFAINTYTLTVEVGANGACNQSTQTVNWNTKVGFLFTPNTGYHINDVAVNGSSVGAVSTLSVLVEGPTTINASFAINTYTLTVNVGANGVSNQTTQTVNWGTIVGFLFTPNAGYHIGSVTVNGSSVGTANTLSVLIEGPTTVGVAFAINVYALTVNVGSNGICNQSTQTVNWGTTVGFVFTPNAGYHVSNVMINGSSSGTPTTLSILVKGPTTVGVSFAINTYNLTVNVGANGVSNQSSATINWGTTVGFLFTPNSGYHVSSVGVNGTSVGTANTLSVLVEGSTTVDVSFAINTYLVTVDVGPHGFCNQTSETVVWRTTVGFLFSPDSGYHVSDVLVNGSSVGAVTTLSILVEGPTTLDASFSINTCLLTVNVGTHGSSNQTTETVDWGTTVGLLFTPDTGYHISNVAVNGSSVGTPSTLSVLVEGPTTVNVTFAINTATSGVSLVAGTVGITGYKLLFKETMNNSLSSPVTINYHWNFSADKWNGTQWVAAAISGSSAPVLGYTLPANSTVNLPFYVYLLSTSTVTFGEWLRITYSFNFTHAGISYSADYASKSNVHPADTSGAAVAPPYFGADGKVSTADLTLLARYWGRSVLWTGIFDPTDSLHIADTGMYGKVSTGDLTILAKYWGLKGVWSSTPPPG